MRPSPPVPPAWSSWAPQANRTRSPTTSGAGGVDAVVAACREHQAGLLVGAHTGAELRALAEWPEVTAALCLVPPFLRPGEEAVLAHYARLAETSPVPLVAYHVPYRTGQQLSADLLRRLARLPRVVGIKHAVGGIDADTLALLADVPPDWRRTATMPP